MLDKNKKNKKKGFTLIELLVAVLIIGVLSGIAVPTYLKSVEKSRATESLSMLGSIAKAEQIHKMQTSEYTDDVDDLDISFKSYSEDPAASFDTEFFDFQLGDQSATAVRKNGGEYTFAIDYATSKITCSPEENSICQALGLEGSPSQGQGESISQPTVNTSVTITPDMKVMCNAREDYCNVYQDGQLVNMCTENCPEGYWTAAETNGATCGATFCNIYAQGYIWECYLPSMTCTNMMTLDDCDFNDTMTGCSNGEEMDYEPNESMEVQNIVVVYP